MEYIQNKWLFYIVTFFLVTVVATVLSAMKPGDKTPDVSNAILIVGAVYVTIYLIIKFFKRFKKGDEPEKIEKETPETNQLKRDFSLKLNNKLIVGLVAALTIILGFYWFQIRPTRIRQECSWVKKHADARSAIPPMSDDEIRVAGCTNRSTGIYADLLDKYCEEKKIGRPAEDAKDWIEPASKDIYDFCIRSKGLFH